MSRADELLQAIVDNEDRLEKQVAIHSALRTRQRLFEEARAYLRDAARDAQGNSTVFPRPQDAASMTVFGAHAALGAEEGSA